MLAVIASSTSTTSGGSASRRFNFVNPCASSVFAVEGRATRGETAMKPARRRRPRHDAPLVDVAWPAGARDLDCSGHSSGADSFDRSLRAAAAVAQEKPPGRRPRVVVGLLLAQVAAVSTGVHYSREIRLFGRALDRVGFLRYKLGKVSQRATVAALNDWNRDLGEVEEATGALEDVRAGINGAVLAYGQSGAGKSHTMNGGPGDPGVVQRVRARPNLLSSRLENVPPASDCRCRARCLRRARLFARVVPADLSPSAPSKRHATHATHATHDARDAHDARRRSPTWCPTATRACSPARRVA